MATEHKEHAGDCPADADIESVEEEETGQEIANRILQFPNVLAALQQQKNAEMLANLPPSVKRRIKALKKLQFETTNIEAKFFKEVHALECKYHNLYVPHYEKRNQVVNGSYEPTEDEAQWPSDDEDEELAKEFKKSAKIEEIKEKKEEPKEEVPVQGIPEFWLTIFKNVNLLAEMVQPHDEPIMKHLIDVKVICKEEPMGFILEFHFSPNEFFTNTVLTKEYEMKCEPEEEDPFNFEGPEIVKCTGCTINWNKGKNVTLKTIKKKQKHKNRDVFRTVTKMIQNDSFFNFFTPPVIPDDTKDEEIDEELRNLLTSDFEIGHYLRERIVPKAVLYFTGEAIEEEEEDYDDEEEEDDEEEDENETKENSKYIEENCKQS